MADEKPVLYLLYGDDSFEMEAFVSEMVARLGDPGMAELNLTRLDGNSASEEDLRTAVQSLPFLAERRLVILSNPLAKLRSDPARARFISMLDTLPPSTALILVVSDELSKGEWKTLKEKHWLMQWARAAGKRAYLAEKRMPGSLSGWIAEHAVQAGGKFERPAADLLASIVAADKGLAMQEIEKLLTYVDFSRPVDVEDVQSLTAPAGHTNVFALVDAIAAGDKRSATRSLGILLQEDEPFGLFGMIVRQFRLLIQARDAQDAGLNLQSFIKETGINPFVAEKGYNQARRFTMPQLVQIYHRLLQIDEDVKTSQVPFELALQIFVAEV